jgi:hypothetical protein
MAPKAAVVFRWSFTASPASPISDRIVLPCGHVRAAPANTLAGNAAPPGTSALFEYYASKPGNGFDKRQMALT